MPDETLVQAPTPTPPAVHVRVRQGMRRQHNWVQLVKFVLVGGSGYIVNLVTFAVAHELLGAHHLAAATIAFVVAVCNNFWWNRHWTFGAGAGHPGFQAARFFTVSVTAFLVNLAALQLLVTRTELPEIVAQAIAIVAATPLNFIGNKMWSFAHGVPRR